MFFIAFILGWVEGLTEFIPVSSTGHLILVGSLLHFTGDLASTFEVFIQLGAILAVVVVYRDRFLGLFSFKQSKGFSGFNGLLMLAVTTLPALVIGFATHHVIKEKLFNPFTVAIGLAVGGVWIILAEQFMKSSKKEGLDNLNWIDALVIGFFQCLALWPGMSRSASTILGARTIGIERKTAAEYSFFAAVPVMCAATLLDLVKARHFLHASDIPFFGIGFVVSFIAAWLCIRIFIQFVGKHTIAVFGWYRLAVALAVFLILR